VLAYDLRKPVEVAGVAGRYEMRRITLNLIAFASAIAAPHLANAQATCPLALAVEEKASAPAPDWTVTYTGYKTMVAGVTIFDGPPADQASLVPDNEQTTEDVVSQTWKLAKSDRGYWLQCEYANTTAQIYRRLPASVTRCDVSYERNVRFGGEGRRVVKSVSCK
jgi:hypothetical protein